MTQDTDSQNTSCQERKVTITMIDKKLGKLHEALHRREMSASIPS